MPLKLTKLTFVALTAAIALGGCVTNPSKDGSSSASGDKSASAENKVPPGMNAKGEVIDSSKVEEGHGKRVKGLNDWEGEITGKSTAHSKFTKLKIGMSMQQVINLIGQPSDQGAYVTGKAWIPFYFGSDRTRYEMVYQKQGRLIFAGGAMGDYSGHLIWIINNAHEPATR